MTLPAILCIEDNATHFAASHEISASGTYEVLATTSLECAEAVLKAVPRIAAAVLPYGLVTLEQQFRVARKLEEARPEIPKVVVGFEQVSAEAEALHLSYVESISLLVAELHWLSIKHCIEHRRIAGELDGSLSFSHELRAESKMARKQSQRLRKHLREHLAEQRRGGQGRSELPLKRERERILIVSSERDIGNEFRDSPQLQECSLVAVPNGAQAVDLFRKIHDSVAIVVLDAGMQAVETIDELQLIDPSCPTIVCASAGDKNLPMLRGKNIAAVLHRPINQQVVGFAIRTLMERLERKAL